MQLNLLITTVVSPEYIHNKYPVFNANLTV